MRSAVAFALIVLMFATPATQVLAQTPHQQDVPARQDVPPAQPVTVDVTPEQSLVPELPMTNPMDALLPAQNVGLAVALNPVDELAPAPVSDQAQLVILFLVILLVIAVLVCVGAECEE